MERSDPEFRSGLRDRAAARWGALWGAPPGVGADYLVKNGLNVMQVAGADKKMLAYYKAELGAAYVANDGNYLDFTKIAGHPPPPATPFQFQYGHFHQQRRPGAEEMVFRAHNGKELREPTFGYSHSYARKKGLLVAGRDGVLHTLSRAGHPTFYIYVEDTQDVWELDKMGATYSIRRPLP